MGDTKSSLNKHQLEHIRVAFISVCYAVHYSTSDTLMLLVKVHMLCLMKVVDTHVLLMSNNVMQAQYYKRISIFMHLLMSN